MTESRTVAVYRADLLPLSETFIKKQVSAMSRWTPVLVGRRRLSSSLDLSDVQVRCMRAEGPSLPSRAWWSFLRRTGLNFAVERALLRRLNASLVHVHFGVDAVDLWPTLRGLSIPVVVTLHGYDVNIETHWWEAGEGGEGHRGYHQELVAMGRDQRVSFIAVSEAIKRRAVDLGLPEEKIEVVHIGVDVREFVPGRLPVSERPIRVLFVGRLVEKKGCEILIRAMERVSLDMPGAELLVIGEGPLKARCELLAAKLGVRTIFLGGQPSSRVRAELDQARVFCLPSVRATDGDAEGLPIVILEAQASGVPVVTSANGGREEGIIDGKTGYAFPEGDVSALASRLALMLSDSAVLDEMSVRAVNFVRQCFDIRDCTARLEAHYDGLVGDVVGMCSSGKSRV